MSSASKPGAGGRQAHAFPNAHEHTQGHATYQQKKNRNKPFLLWTSWDRKRKWLLFLGGNRKKVLRALRGLARRCPARGSRGSSVAVRVL